MRILIGKPTRHIEMFQSAAEQNLMYIDDIVKLYDVLPNIIERLGFECVEITITKHLRRIYQEKNSIFLAWHNHGTTKNTWFIKDSYLPNYFYFDKTGYSGWSELVEDYNYDVDVSTIRNEVRSFADNYIANKTSRYGASEQEIPQRPYVLAFEQRPDDAVSDFAYIQGFIEKVQETLGPTKYDVVVKPHPLNLTWSREKKTWDWSINDTGSLHDLIAGSSAIYTVNSSAGFESLLHNKRVFTGGQCDYHWATDVIKTEENLKRSVDLIDEPVDEDRITKFLHYCLNYHFMNVNDEKSIERKILRAVNGPARTF